MTTRIDPVQPPYPPELQKVLDSIMPPFSVEQILELIALVGFYHSVSFFANGLKLRAEVWSAPFPSA